MGSRKRYSVLVLLILAQYIASLLIVGGAVVTTAPHATPSGEQRIAVILCCFPNHPPKNDVKQIYERVFVNACQMVRSVSYDQCWLTGQVSGWVVLDKNLESYGRRGGNDIVKDVVAKIDPSFDFSNFDRLLVIHSGPSYQLTNRNESFPSDSWCNLLVPTLDGRTFRDRMLVSEDCSIRTIVHELGHSLGAVDLYNKPRSEGIIDSNETYIGPWCIMGSGYAQMCLFTECKIGWIPSHDVYRVRHESSAVDILGMSEVGMGYRGIRFDIEGDCKYYLIEARTRCGLDSYKDEGVLITLVDERIEAGYGIIDVVSSCSNNSVRHAPFEVHQSFQDPDNGFFLHVISRTKQGFNVSVGVDYTVEAENAVFSAPRSTDFAREVSLSMCYDGLVYCAVERTTFVGDYLNFIEVHKSIDSGRTWHQVFNTTGLNLNFSDAVVCVLDDDPVLIARGWNHTASQLMLLTLRNELETHVLVDEVSLRGISAVPNPELAQVFLSWGEWNSSSGLCRVCYGAWNGNIWKASSSYLGNARHPRLSNAPLGHDGIPLMLYRDTSSYARINLTVFNGTEVLASWTNRTEGSFTISSYDIIVAEENIVVALTELAWQDGDMIYNTRISRGCDPNSLKDSATLQHIRQPLLFSYIRTSESCLGMLVFNESSWTRVVLNLTDDVESVTQIHTTDNCQLSKTSTQGIESIVIISCGASSASTMYAWSLFIGPRPPLEVLTYYTADTGMVNITFYALVVMALLGIITGVLLSVTDAGFHELTGRGCRTLARRVKGAIASYFDKTFAIGVFVGTLTGFAVLRFFPVLHILPDTYQIGRVIARSILWDMILFMPVVLVIVFFNWLGGKHNTCA